MAGYIMNLNSTEALINCIETGTYSTNMKEPTGKWKTYHEGTFADFLSMKSGDNIYFFIKRKIYGIGLIRNVGYDCKYLNFEGADLPIEVSKDEYNKKNPLLFNATSENRCFCTFEPTPFFFKNGIDMDDALNSNPEAFKMLRAMWKLSFIKIDDKENQALIDIILKRNEEKIFSGKDVFDYEQKYSLIIENNVTELHRLSAYNILASCSNNKSIKHEMAIEAALCEELVLDNNTPFGKWDYISHQVIASPFKAIDYMDKMDVFGYRYIPSYKTVSKYLVIEIKKDMASEEVIEQIMKYVDWIQQEYAHGDYSMIEAYVVAADFTKEMIRRKNYECKRFFTKGYRPAVACIWEAVHLIKYRYDDIDKKLLYEEISTTS